MGSSTSDCVAVIRAMAQHCRTSLDPESIARIAHQAERSSDSTMFGGRVVAFLHTEGCALENLGASLPRLRVLAVEPPGPCEDVCTDLLRRPRYVAAQIESYNRLLIRLRGALERNDVAEIGAVASASAAVNQEFLPKPHFDAVTSVAARTQALGVAAAHSGTILALLYPENANGNIAAARDLLSAQKLDHVRDLRTWPDTPE
jgi:uncharacterized protein involved in propanediol utilization